LLNQRQMREGGGGPDSQLLHGTGSPMVVDYVRTLGRSCGGVWSLQGVTAASSGTHTHAGAESRRLAWRSLVRPSEGQRSYRRGAAEIPAGSL